MDKINELLFVIENYAGIAEHNVLYTKEEFLSFLRGSKLFELTESVEVLLNDPDARFDWRTLYVANGTFEFRCCRDERDLCAFLSGTYNNSPEKMADRNLDVSERFGRFKWDILPSCFSPRSISLFASLAKGVPTLNAAYANLFNRENSLDDIIHRCETERKHAASQFVNPVHKTAFESYGR